MSKKHEKVTFHEEREVVTEVTCDWCGKEIKRRPYSQYNYREFTLRFTYGNQYPDGGYFEGWEVEDLCDDCVKKLKDLLETNGVKTAEVEG